VAARNRPEGGAAVTLALPLAAIVLEEEDDEEENIGMHGHDGIPH